MTELLDGTLVISEVLAVFALEHLEEVVNNGGRNPRRQDACRRRSRSPRTRRCLRSEWTHQGLPPLACTLPRYDQRLAIDLLQKPRLYANFKLFGKNLPCHVTTILG